MNPSRTPENVFDDSLLPLEKVLWTGQPLVRILFHSSDWFAIPFSFMWGGFAIFWEFGVTTGGKSGEPASLFMTLWGIPFVLIGQYIIWGRFLYAAWTKRRTFYALTNQRVLVWSAGFTKKLTDGLLIRLDSVTLTERADGCGAIEFSPDPVFNAYKGRRRSSPGMDLDYSRLAFYDIAQAGEVYALIQTERVKLPRV